MTRSTTGVSVIIPTGGTQRLHLLDATLAGMRRSHGIAQIIVSEAGPTAHAAEIARRWDADYVFTADNGKFNRSLVLNMGSVLAREEVLLWCDGDILFEPDFVPLAQDELYRRKLDLLQPYTVISYLSEKDSAQVCQGKLSAAQCKPIEELRYCPGAVSMVRAAFLRRHGGMSEAFFGWGWEDNAWVHKVRVLGRMAWTDQPEQRVRHLFHPQSTRDMSNLDQNLAVFRAMEAITDPAAFAQAYPAIHMYSPPWQNMDRIEFFVPTADPAAPAALLAAEWQEWLAKGFGSAPKLRMAGLEPEATMELTAELIVIIAETHAAGTAELARRTNQNAILVVMDTDDADMPTLEAGACHWLLPRTAAQAARWSPSDERVWHRPWDIDTGKAAPVLAQLLSHALAQPKRWRVRIAIDRAALAPEALDRSPFWYVGLQDAEGADLARHDADGLEVFHLARQTGQALELERTVVSPRPPARWTVWPVDRHRRWLQPVHGQICRPSQISGRRDSA